MPDSDGDAVRYDVDGDGIVVLTLDLPGHSANVLGSVLSQALQAAVERALADPAVTTGVVLTSAKSTFVAGGDLKAMGSDKSRSKASESPTAQRVETLLALSRDIRRLETGGKPVVCALSGTALGGGFEIALGCHYRVAADLPALRLGLPEAGVGLLPGAGGTQRLPRLIGIAAATRILLSGAPLTAAEALAAGLVHEVVPAGQLVDAAKNALRQGLVDPVQPWDRPGWALPGGTPATSEEVRDFFTATNSATRARTFGNLPAHTAILAAVYEGSQLPMDVALRVEAKRLLPLLAGPVSKALIGTMFVSKGKADKLHARPDSVPRAPIDRIGVLGAGMGAGLALVAAKAGIHVVLLDRDEAAAEKGKAYAAGALQRDIGKGRTTREKADTVLARITPATRYEQLAGASAVLEAVFEGEAAKADVTRRAEAVLGADALFVTNPAGLSITGLAKASTRPARFIGMHFLAPADRMPLVEVVPGAETSAAALAHALDLAKALRKTPILVSDSPGFFINRLIGSFISASLEMAGLGVNAALVENSARALGMPRGALAFCDDLGLGAAARIGGSGWPAGAPEAELITALVRGNGRQGRKNGKGFYDYHADGTKTLWPGLAGLVTAPGEQPAPEQVRERIRYAQLAEAARAFAEGVLRYASDGDVAAVLGAGFPAHLGGPFTAIDQDGLPRVLATLDRLAAAHGDRFAAPPLLREMASAGQTFNGANPVPSPAVPRD